MNENMTTEALWGYVDALETDVSNIMREFEKQTGFKIGAIEFSNMIYPRIRIENIVMSEKFRVEL